MLKCGHGDLIYHAMLRSMNMNGIVSLRKHVRSVQISLFRIRLHHCSYANTVGDLIQIFISTISGHQIFLNLTMLSYSTW